MSDQETPFWFRLAVVLALAAPAAALLAFAAGSLQGSHRNLVPFTALGGLLALLLLAGHALRFMPHQLPAPNGQRGVFLLTLVAACFVGIYFWQLAPLLLLPYDLASWSEPMFVVDMIKLRTGTSLYLPAEYGNSNSYTFGAPVLTYFIAWLLRHPASIVLYRLIQQFYLVLAALFGAAATSRLGRLVAPEGRAGPSRLWFAFFSFALFLFATNSNTARQNIYLHNESLAWLASGLAFWLLMQYATTRKDRWFWAMTVMPTLAMLVKQYLVIWAVVYLVFFWLDGAIPFRRLLAFAVASFGLVALTLGVCRAVWGAPFLFWVFESMSSYVISVQRLLERFLDVGWELALGLFAAWILLRGDSAQRILGIFFGWIALVVGGLYVMAVAPYPTYFGPATLVAGCFFLAALRNLWPAADRPAPSAEAWLHFGLGFAAVLAVFAGLGHPRAPEWKKTPDLVRYVAQIEHEFAGLPAERVLLDECEWIYLRAGVVMKDRQPILVTPRVLHLEGLLDRVHTHYYQRILVHVLPDGRYLYDEGRDRGIRQSLLQHYREIRRIPGIHDLKVHYANLMFGDVAVLEPLSGPAASPAGGGSE